MSIPTSDNVFLHELELDVRAELTLIETSQPETRPPAYRSTSGCPIRLMTSATKLTCAAFSAPSRPWKTAPAPGPGPTAPTGSPRRKVDKRCRSHDNTWLTYCG